MEANAVIQINTWMVVTANSAILHVKPVMDLQSTPVFLVQALLFFKVLDVSPNVKKVLSMTNSCILANLVSTLVLRACPKRIAPNA